MLIVTGLEETLPDCLHHIVLYNVSFFILIRFYYFLFQFFVLYVISASPFHPLSIGSQWGLSSTVRRLKNSVTPTVKKGYFFTLNRQNAYKD